MIDAYETKTTVGDITLYVKNEDGEEIDACLYMDYDRYRGENGSQFVFAPKTTEKRDVTLKLGFPIDGIPYYGDARNVPFKEILTIMEGKSVRWRGRRIEGDEELENVDGTFKCTKVDGEYLLGFGTIKKSGIQTSTRTIHAEEGFDGNKSKYWIEQTSGERLSDLEKEREAFLFYKDQLKRELLSKIRASSKNETNKNNQEDRKVNIENYVSILRSVMAQLHTIRGCGGELRYFVEQSIGCCDFAKHIRRMLSESIRRRGVEKHQVGQKELNFERIWRFIDSVRYGNRGREENKYQPEFKLKDYSAKFRISSDFHQPCNITFEADNKLIIAISIYHLSSYVEEYVHKLFSDDTKDGCIKDYLEEHHSKHSYGLYSIPLPQDIGTGIIETFLRRNEEWFNNIFKTKFKEGLLKSGLLQNADLPIDDDVKGPGCLITFRLEPETTKNNMELYLERDAEECVREVSLALRKKVVENLNVLDLPRETLAECSVDEYRPTLLKLVPNLFSAERIGVPYWDERNIKRGGREYVPEYIIEKGAVSRDIEKIELSISREKDDKYDILFFKVMIVVVLNVEVIDTNKIHRVLFEPNDPIGYPTTIRDG